MQTEIFELPGLEGASLPREVVLASAGTGKTFRISSRIIGLLAMGEPVDSIFASTFTRKAAGEILDRVLLRIAAAATDPDTAADLAGHATLPGCAPPEAAPDAWHALLRRLIDDLHRVNIGTIDAFFVGAAGVFADQLGLPPGWRIADETSLRRLRTDAVHAVLGDGDPSATIELVRALRGGDSRRSVHDSLMSIAGELVELHHDLAPTSGDAWGALSVLVDGVPEPTSARREALATALLATELPRTRAGHPNKNWQTAIDRIAGSIRGGNWDSLARETLCEAASSAGGSYSGHPVPEEVCALVGEAMQLSRREIAARLLRQGRAMGRLAGLLAKAIATRQRETGAYGFSDITRLVGGPDAILEKPELYFRMDTRSRHILLDEFQDTSLAQWEALEPLIDEIASGYVDERAAVVVADPKQSIYAWRGGEPALVRHIENNYGFSKEGMHRSYRSSRTVLEVVNRVFTGIASNAAWKDDEVRGIAEEWGAAFERHTAADTRLGGYVAVTVGPMDEGNGADRPHHFRHAAQLAARLHRERPDASIGILTRRNATIARIIMGLRAEGIAGSEEGGNALTDSPAVGSVLALLRLVDHPADRIARYHVASTPVGRAVGLSDHADDGAAERIARDFRRRLIRSGYGPTLSWVAERIRAACTPRDRRRLRQLAELGLRFDDGATLRTADFIERVAAERVEDPTAANVRVMTVHKAKGLEFDIVILPELDQAMERGGRTPATISYRPDPARRPTLAFPYIGKPVAALVTDVPEVAAARAGWRAGRIRDALSALYVAMTRPRHELHILICPDPERGMTTACTPATVVRHALGLTEPALEGQTLFERGDRGWAREKGAPAAATSIGSGDGDPVRFREGPRTRSFARRAPSELAGGSRVDLRMVLNIRSGATVAGSIVHAWMEQIEWIEDGTPDETTLRAVAAAVDPTFGKERVDQLLAKWRAWVADPVIERLLSRDRYAPAADCERELRFIHREADALMEGAIDRLVIERDGSGAVTGATIIDYKTDAIDGDAAQELSKKIEMYRPQLNAYRRAVADWYRIAPERVRCVLAVLEARAVVEV